ncbi:CsbD family protein [Cognatiluteimonas profundi]|uniref:CsbD family protein n=1 Tax=Cognatiluteimonas profundi TaxID=2594501 RepID=UPI00131E67CF|nr:CsbD family protein [Lysobacter profundi]
MDNNRIDGMGHEVKGAIKEQIGQATGNRSQQVEGNIEKNVGKAEQMIGAMADRMRTEEAKR